MLIWPIRKWFGVSGCKLVTSPLTSVSGRLFINCSTTQSTVRSLSSFKLCLPRTFYKALLQDFTRPSYTPPKWGATGGLKVHLMLSSASLLAISSFLSSWKASLNSLAAPKFVPLSEIIYWGWHLLGMNSSTAPMQASVSKLSTSSSWTALKLKRVKRHTHFFIVCLNIFTSNGPK